MSDPLAGVSRETIFQLRELEVHLLDWAGRFNLVAPSTLQSVWERHILDSAQLVHLAPQALRWLDLGSGGGFPGLVIATLLRKRSGAMVDLVESSRKKSAFLLSAITRFALPAAVHTMRIEQLTGVARPDAISARALAPLDELLGLASPWLVGPVRGFFHKGRRYRDEIEKTRDVWRFELAVHPSMTEEGAAILEIANLRRKAD